MLKKISKSDKPMLILDDCICYTSIKNQHADYYVNVNGVIESSVNLKGNILVIDMKLKRLICNRKKVDKLCNYLLESTGANKITIYILKEEKYIRNLLFKTGFVRELMFEYLKLTGNGINTLEIYSRFKE